MTSFDELFPPHMGYASERNIDGEDNLFSAYVSGLANQLNAYPAGGRSSERGTASLGQAVRFSERFSLVPLSRNPSFRR